MTNKKISNSFFVANNHIQRKQVNTNPRTTSPKKQPKSQDKSNLSNQALEIVENTPLKKQKVSHIDRLKEAIGQNKKEKVFNYKNWKNVWSNTETIKDFRKFGGQELRKSLDGKILALRSDLDIDTDGSGPAHGDQGHWHETSLCYKDGSFVNADDTPYFVLPKEVADKYGVKLGDFAAVRYGDKIVPAIYADSGPTGMIGEGSYRLAKELGINPNPNGGGVKRGVEMLIFPGSGEDKAWNWTPEETSMKKLKPRVENVFKKHINKNQPPKETNTINDNTDTPGDKFLTFGHKDVNGEYYDNNGTWLDTKTSVSWEQVEAMGWKQKKAFFEKLGIEY